MPDIHDNVEQIFLCYNICLLYQDGRQEPRGGQQYRTLTNPRWISQRNHPDEDLPDTRYTHMVMQFGQFLDHDLTLTPKDGNAPGGVRVDYIQAPDWPVAINEAFTLVDTKT